MSEIHNPSYLGETLRDDVLHGLGLSVTKAAKQLNISRAALSRVLNGRSGISSEIALRLEGWLGVENGGRTDLWVAQQVAYDLWNLRKAGLPKAERANVPHTFANLIVQNRAITST